MAVRPRAGKRPKSSVRCRTSVLKECWCTVFLSIAILRPQDTAYTGLLAMTEGRDASSEASADGSECRPYQYLYFIRGYRLIENPV